MIGGTVAGGVESAFGFNETFNFCAEADLFTTLSVAFVAAMSLFFVTFPTFRRPFQKKPFLWFQSIAYSLNSTFPLLTKASGLLERKFEGDGVFGFRVIGNKALLMSLLRYWNQNTVQKKGKLNPDWNFFKLFVKFILKLIVLGVEFFFLIFAFFLKNSHFFSCCHLKAVYIANKNCLNSSSLLLLFLHRGFLCS